MDTYPVRIPIEVMEELSRHTGYIWCDMRLEPLLVEAIRNIMRPAAPVAAPAQEPAAGAGHGYQWKQVFLPEGTRLRAAFHRTPCFAVVRGGVIQHGELALSPSGFANLHGSGNRNAWKAVWLQFPGSEQWVLADVCRATQQAAIARLFTSTEPAPAAARPPSPRPAASASPASPSSPQRKNKAKGKRAKKGKRHARRVAARPSSA